MQRDWSDAQQAVQQLANRQEELSARVTDGEATLESARQELLAAVSQLADFRNQLVQAEENGLALDRQAARMKKDVEAVDQEHHRLAAEFESSLSRQDREQSTLAGLAESVRETTTALDAARAEEALRRSGLDALRQEFSNAQARRQALEESLARHSYSTESVRRLLAHNDTGNGNGFHPLGVLADFVEVSPEYEEVVEEFLQNELDCVVVEQHAEARSGISLLRSEGTGRSTFFVTRVPSNAHGNEETDAQVRSAGGVLASVKELVRFEARLGLNGDLAFPALANAYVVQDSETAERLATTYPECHFLTTSGDHYHHRLVTGGKGRSAGPLALRRDFRELERRAGELES
jgi:chromosome segregation protein